MVAGVRESPSLPFAGLRSGQPPTTTNNLFPNVPLVSAPVQVFTHLNTQKLIALGLGTGCVCPELVHPPQPFLEHAPSLLPHP